MKTTHFALILILVSVSLETPAADNLLSGARAAGMANATVSIYDFWAISHNQAGIAMTDTFTAGFFAENRFLVKDLTLASIAAILPTSSGNFGASLNFFGSSLYSEGKAGLAYARRLGENLSAGIQLNYMFTSIGDGFGSTGTVAAELGVICQIMPKLYFGAHIFNPTKSKLKTINDHDIKEHISTIIRTGAAYHFSRKVLLCIEVEKDIRHKPMAKIGIEYMITDGMFVRAGISSNPAQNAFGFGLHTGNLRIDISASYHYLLGYTPQLGVMHVFK
jgi:hypothetical protein